MFRFVPPTEFLDSSIDFSCNVGHLFSNTDHTDLTDFYATGSHPYNPLDPCSIIISVLFSNSFLEIQIISIFFIILFYYQVFIILYLGIVV